MVDLVFRCNILQLDFCICTSVHSLTVLEGPARFPTLYTLVGGLMLLFLDFLTAGRTFKGPATRGWTMISLILWEVKPSLSVSSSLSLLFHARVVKTSGYISVGRGISSFARSYFWIQSGLSSSSISEQETQWPRRFSVRTISVFPVKTFTANGRSMCLGGFILPHVIANTKSLPRELAGCTGIE